MIMIAVILSIKFQESTSADICQHFDSTMYETSPAATPLYERSAVTVLEAIAQHILWFTDHLGTSKDALSSILHMQRHKILPQPNFLADSYSAAFKISSLFLFSH